MAYIQNNHINEMLYFSYNSINDQKETLVPQKVYNWLDEEKISLYYIDKIDMNIIHL